MNKITLITTEGCVGCEVMKNSINQALKESKTPVTLEVLDIKDVSKKFLQTFKIVDFPATIFFKDEKYLFKKVGSVPTIVVLRWIDVHFK